MRKGTIALGCLVLAACGGTGTATTSNGQSPIDASLSGTSDAGTTPITIDAGTTPGTIDAGSPGQVLDAGSLDAGSDNAGRLAAVQAVVTQDPLCTNLSAFYWEIGDKTGTLASGTGGVGTPPLPTDTMPIASASKLIFAVYMMERHAGALTADEIKYLTFESGYTNFSSCGVLQSVDECLAAAGKNGGSNGDYDPDTVDHFFYNGGHMQKLASLVGLGSDRDLALANDLKLVLGTSFDFSYSEPQLAGGGRASAQGYALFLRHLLDGTYPHALALLGSHAVCTHPGPDCPSAIYSPVNQSTAPVPPATTPNDVSEEKWHYSLGHWVEDDPDVGDGSFSSPGAFGFYPWIDASKTHYGLLARADLIDAGSSDPSKVSGVASVHCGRLIRKAWFSAR